MRKASFVVVGVLTAGLVLSGCEGDPNDPRTWARKLKSVRDQKEALDQLAKMSVDRAQQALPEMVALYKETKKPDHLEALSRFPTSRPSRSSSKPWTSPRTTSTGP